MKMWIVSLVLPVAIVLSASARAQSSVVSASDQSVDALVRAEILPFKGKVFLFAKNLDTGVTYSFNGDERVRTASTIKVAVMIEAFARVAEDGRNGPTSWCSRKQLGTVAPGYCRNSLTVSV